MKLTDENGKEYNFEASPKDSKSCLGNLIPVAPEKWKCPESKSLIDGEDKADNIQNYCCLGKSHLCPLNVNDGYCAAVACQYKVEEL